MKISLRVVIILSFLLLPALFFIFRSNHTQAQNPPPAPSPQTSRREKLDCASCHGPGKTLPQTGGEPFHRDAHRQHLASIHAKVQPDGKPAATCKDCHTLNGDMTTDLPADNPNSTVFSTNQEKTCGRCHDKALTTFHNSIHGRLLEKGDTRAASCSDCHGRHTIKAVNDPESPVTREHVPDVCIKCHSGIVPAYEQSAHFTAFKNGNPKAPVCIDCHTSISHDTAPASTRDFALMMVNKCSECHTAQAPSYRDTFHGQAAAFNYRLAATCADCHTPHKNLPKSNPESSVNKNNLVQTCAQCHTDAKASFVSFNPHPDPKNPEKGYGTYFVNTFLKYLLLGVFCLFGLHTLLWLQRSLVAFVKGERRPAASAEEQWVVRFSRSHRLTHLLIIVSFIGLAATGLPLLYFFTDWGHWVVAVFGGLGVTRFLHRSFALVTFAYVIYHLWSILRSAIVDGAAVFRGPYSLMPRGQDFKDLAAMIKWFLYRGPKPQIDHFAYWEKLDYLAVVLSLPVIAFSGLMLWFPGFFSRILSGSALNVAMVVHSEQTLMMTAFIFAFHFIHNHLLPERFPMDTVMFTGRMPLSRFREERPAEYERLVAEGKLDSITVPPPSPKFSLFAKVFGFVAYLIGLFLVVAIFVTLFTVK
ncbi:MAG: cytochrome b/b6 domain-containing protein [Acidobacteria bacterium]|nr:cytochrome b/b6 domain-containing protein [Acidobacteriota bacterium]